MFELLSPAGSFDALKAAVQNGADSVYLGGSSFSARASACNFNNEELILAVKYAHLRGVKIFVTVNTSIKEKEMNDFINYTDFLYKINVDALIISDIGVMNVLKNRYPNMEIHASTQICCHSLKDAIELEKFKFNRVVLARELNLDEIKEICKKTNLDIEVFVHGALCICYSGQCLMSSNLGTRSGNRGKCAQPCRQKYKLIDKEKNIEIKNIDGSFLLSPKDLCTIENIEKILKTGVKSLKIEGRMKKKEYVAIVTSTYRKALDNFLKNKETKDKKTLVKNLKTIFNREFTSGYIMKKNLSNIINLKSPKNIGLKVGEVLEYNEKTHRLKIKLFDTLSKGDCINLGFGNIGRIIKNEKILESATKGETIEIDFIKNVKKETTIYKTFDKNLIEDANKTVKEGLENKRIKIKTQLFIKTFEKIKLILNEREFFSKEIIQKATNKRADVENILQKLSKTKNTPFDFEFEKVVVDKDAFVPVSVLNNLKRYALEMYETEILNSFERKINYIKEDFNFNFNFKKDFGKITLKIKENEKLDLFLKNIDYFSKYIKEIYTEDFFNIKKYYDILKLKNIKLIYSAPSILRNNDYEILKNQLKNIDKSIFSKVGISTFGEKSFFKENFFTKEFNIDTYFNIYNSHAIKYFINNFNTNNITISQELNKDEIKEMIFNLDEIYKKNICIDMIIYGHSRSMITEYSPIKYLTKNYNKNTNSYILKDSLNREFPIFEDIFLRTEIRNYKALDLRENIKEIFSLGVNRVRFDFTHEDKFEIFKILKETIDFLEKGKKITLKEKPYLSHFYTSIE